MNELDHRHSGERHIKWPPGERVINHEPHVEREIGVSVECRIQKRAKRGHAPDATRHLPIRHVQKRRKKKDGRRRGKSPHRKQRRRPGIHGQPKEREHIGRDARRRKAAHHVTQQPAAAFADPIRDRAFQLGALFSISVIYSNHRLQSSNLRSLTPR